MCANEALLNIVRTYNNIKYIKLWIPNYSYFTIGIIEGKWMLSFNNDYLTMTYDLKTYFYD